MRSLVIGTLVSSVLSPLAAYAQFGGSRAGVHDGSSQGNLVPLSPDVATRYVTIEGRAEIRVKPTELRAVLAVTGEGQTAAECRANVERRIAGVLAAWQRRGIDPDDVQQDFVAILPRYEWTIEKRGTREVAVESLVGYRMQTNLHLAVPNEAAAKAALDDAFAGGVTDVIGFDYWSRDLDETRRRARAAAVKAARDKAEVLLAVFVEPPTPINVQDDVTVHFPTSLYESFENSDSAGLSAPYRSDLPTIRAARPKNTYYRGLDPDADVASPELPMRPEISVVATVRIYYLSPSAELFAGEDD